MIFGSARVTEEKLSLLRSQQAVLLIAFSGEVEVGFKLGYVIPQKSAFFSWLGGVHPDYRRQGIAQSLLEKQEAFARMLGMETIYFTTFDRFPAMIELGKKNNYSLVKSLVEDDGRKYWYEKALN